MDIAVTEMTEVHHRKLVLGAQISGVRDQLGDAIPRDDHVSFTLPICTLATAALTALRAAQRRCA